MEFLFAGQATSIEAIIMFLCILIVAGIFLVDLIRWGIDIFTALNPRKAYKKEQEREEDKAPSPIGSLTESDTSTQEIATEITGTKLPPEVVPSEEETAKETLPEPVESPQIGESGSPQEDTPETTSSIEAPDAEKEEKIEEKEIPQEEQVTPETEAPTPDGDSETDGANEVLTQEETPETQETSKDESEKGGEREEEEENKEDTTVSLEKEPPQESLPQKEEQEATEKTPSPSKNSPEKKEKLIESVNLVKTLIARGQIDEAKSTIISGLALEKDHRELNLLMASLYEREHHFEKAEFIFKDMARIYPDDKEVLSHLATSLAMQRKYSVSYEMYKKVLSLEGETEDTLYTLTHLASELSLPEEVYTYGKSYLKQYPRNPEILWLYAQALITKGERKEAIENLIKLKNLTPYNQEIIDLIGKLVTEEELAGNFSGERNI